MTREEEIKKEFINNVCEYLYLTLRNSYDEYGTHMVVSANSCSLVEFIEGFKKYMENLNCDTTNNIGAKSVSENCKTVGFSIEENNNERIKSIFNKELNKGLNKELKKRFTPEFLNRLDGIIYFNSIE